MITCQQVTFIECVDQLSLDVVNVDRDILIFFKGEFNPGVVIERIGISQQLNGTSDLFGRLQVVKIEGNMVVGLKNGAITNTDLKKSCRTHKPLDLHLLKLAKKLAT